MQFLGYTAFVTLAAAVAADQTFSLTAKGGKIEQPVNVDSDGVFYLGKGKTATFKLEEPSGYMSVDGKYVSLEQDIHEVTNNSQRSKDFGVENNQLRSGPSEDKFDFYACPSGSDVYTLKIYQADNCQKIGLYLAGASESTSPSSAAPSSSKASSSSKGPSSTKGPVTSSVAPSSEADHTKTETAHSTSVSTLPCDECHKNGTSSSSVPTVHPTNGAASLSYGAGALFAAGLALL